MRASCRRCCRLTLDSRSCAACAALRHATACLTACACRQVLSHRCQRLLRAAGTFQPPRLQRAARRAVCQLASPRRALSISPRNRRASTKSGLDSRHCNSLPKSTVVPPLVVACRRLRSVGQQRVRIYARSAHEERLRAWPAGWHRTLHGSDVLDCCYRGSPAARLVLR